MNTDQQTEPAAIEGKQAAATGLNTYCVRVTGRVQGVGYRNFTVAAADSLRMRGWVRNEPDGSVRAVLQSPDTRMLETLIERLKEGPSKAQVDAVFIEQVTDEDECLGFEIRR